MGIGPNPFRVTLKGFISPPKAPGFRAEWAPLGPFLLGGGWYGVKTGGPKGPRREHLKKGASLKKNINIDKS